VVQKRRSKGGTGEFTEGERNSGAVAAVQSGGHKQKAAEREEGG
jgi:hypothetical protein